MQIVVMAILILALTATATTFVVMGIRQTRRTRRLARRAEERGLLFSSDDPFDIPERYRRFTLMSCGHSPRAVNVAHGRLDALPLRAFEFHYEIGHGTRRTTCRYTAVIVDMRSETGDLIMWNHTDAESTPLEARDAPGRIGCWSCRGRSDQAERLAQAAGGLAAEGLSLQIRGTEMLLSLPAARVKGRDYFTWLDEAVHLARTAGGPEDG
ncbi:MAG: hypothetical protein JW849_08270 [Phycisphaerae bacterium]|nr:hypothetical protein [Phycisphaerae bacterium]